MNTVNYEYVKELLDRTEYVYIDTAALMDITEMNLLIQKYGSLFAENKCKIIVLPSVCLELVRHLGNPDKSEKAMQVLEMFKKNPDIFDVENGSLDEADIYKAFADKEIYKTMSEERSYHSQLLITNDRRLSEDIFGLNELQSMRGFPIAVCFINRFGELHRCECVKQAFKAKMEKDLFTGREDIIIDKLSIKQDNENGIYKYNQEEISGTGENTKLKIGLGVLAGFFMGYGTSKYGKSIINSLKTIM
ncbi:hypothetical protein [Butyrivibrio sp. WCD3002]|uniref:hypothetical protein n=1 Tax=Butyrivibrio sp. WCD3002 TaxID=1280676 RepID=UPI000420E4E4|nr:hypothetical protein [Butyrivibrio sp. WCD3002]